jgi:hypothetical protein
MELWQNTLAQSICTHYSCFENMGRFVTLKKNQVQKKAGCKKPGCCYSKREEAIWTERIYNPITAMGFSAMFTFQLNNTKR